MDYFLKEYGGAIVCLILGLMVIGVFAGIYNLL